MLVDKAGDAMSVALISWREATDSAGREVEERRFAEYEAIAREYRVLNAWKDLFYVAYIFSTDGADAAALDGNMPLPF